MTLVRDAKNDEEVMIELLCKENCKKLFDALTARS